jgi:hypothetical protein
MRAAKTTVKVRVVQSQTAPAYSLRIERHTGADQFLPLSSFALSVHQRWIDPLIRCPSLVVSLHLCTAANSLIMSSQEQKLEVRLTSIPSIPWLCLAQVAAMCV